MTETHSVPTRLSQEQLRHHYLVEKELADRLRKASKEERRELYPKVYDELFQRVPFHRMRAEDPDASSRLRGVEKNFRLLSRYIHKDSTFLEIGPGRCQLSLMMAAQVKKVYAVDVSAEIASRENMPGNFELIISDGSSIPVPPESVDVAFSNQLMEHLHPDDAADQVRNVARCLKRGGRYICITPHRFSGPHDVSRHFDQVATGFHLKEYTYSELYRLLADSGFSDVRALAGGKGRYSRVPASLLLPLEALLERIQAPLRRRFASLAGVRIVFKAVTIVATK